MYIFDTITFFTYEYQLLFVSIHEAQFHILTGSFYEIIEFIYEHINSMMFLNLSPVPKDARLQTVDKGRSLSS